MSPQPHVNPYIAGSPVTGTDMFYGREDVFSFVRRNLIGRHRDTPVVLYGQRRTGKTSVLYQLHRHLDPTYRCIFIDLHGLRLDGMTNFWYGVSNSISRGLQRDHQLKVEVPDRSFFLADPRSAFETRFLDEVWSILGEDHLVLMMDEVIRLYEEVEKGRLERDIFDFLRHLMQHHARLNFIFSLGSGLEEMAKDYAFLFSVSLYHRVSFLEPAAARALIVEPAQDHYGLTPQAVTKILQITSGHAYYTQLVCHCMFDLWSRAPKSMMDVADVEVVLAEAIELGSANLTYVWEDSTPEEKALMAGVVAAMRTGAGPATMAQVREAWREVGVSLPEGRIARALRSLDSREVLSGSETYHFSVDLQRLWIEKHRHLDWVKDELAEAVQEWNRSMEPWPADTIPGQAPGPEDTANGRRSDGATARLKLPAIRNRYLALAVAIVLLSTALAATAIARVFPFSNSSRGVNPTQVLTQLLPATVEQNLQECHSVVPANPWRMSGVVLELHCIIPGADLSDGNVYAYQLDNAHHYQSAWQDFNKWWNFTPSNAETKCPPTGASQGLINQNNTALSASDRLSTECGWMVLSPHTVPDNVVPAYAWSYPVYNAFVIAEGSTTSSFSSLDSWLTGASPQKPGSTSSSHASNPDFLLNMIPSSVQGSNNCSNDGTSFGATAVFECSGLQGLAATTIIYYLFPDANALSNGFNNFLTSSDFPASASSCTTNNHFSDFIPNCRDTYTSTSPAASGSVAEYVNKDNDPIIVSTDNQRLVMAVLIGTNDADLLAYWQPLQWILAGS